MRGELAAASTAALFAILGLSFAPLLLISGAVIGLVTLRHGVVAVTKVAALGAVGVRMASHWVQAASKSSKMRRRTFSALM